MNITFVRTRHHYASYVDFWRLVEASEFDTRYIDEIDLADEHRAYIFTPMNGEIEPALRAQEKRRARVVWWALERPSQDPTTPASLDQLTGLIHAVWVSDQAAATWDSRFTYAFMASNANIATRSTEKTYDVCHLAYLWGRRARCISELEARGVKIAPAAYGRKAQDEIVARSRLMLNLHQYEDAALVAPLRFAVAAAYSIPIITERLTVQQFGPFIHESIDKIPDAVERVLREPTADGLDKLDARGFLLHHRFCVATDFRHEVEKRVAAL